MHQTLSEYLKGKKCGPFKPHVWYNHIGRMVHCYWEDEQAYTEERDGFKVLIGMESKRVVGVVIYDYQPTALINQGSTENPAYATVCFGPVFVAGFGAVTGSE